MEKAVALIKYALIILTFLWITFKINFVKTFLCKFIQKGVIFIKASLKSASELAFIGDAVHTLFVRESLLQTQKTISGLNKLCSKYCSARYQAKVVDKIANILNEQESDVLRRGRNLDSKTRAKNASVEEYRKATAFETLIGYLYLQNLTDRLNLILNISMEEL